MLDNPIIQIDNFFPQVMYDTILEDSKHGWENRDTYIYKDLNNSFFTKDCVNYMRSKFNNNITLYRGYAHGYLIHDHHTHQDVNSTHTAILFVAKEYDKDWLGRTIVDDNYLPFFPNRLIIFEANLFHVGSNFQNTKNFRIQYIWKINKEIK